ncbi:metallophosphoesterase [Roseomonas sp. GCM10028921]
MFHVYLLLAYFYLLWRFVLPLPLPRWGRILVGAALLLASKHHLLTWLAFGSMFSPEVPSAVIAVAGWAFGGFLFLFLTMLLLDMARAALVAARLRAAASALGGVRIRCACAAVVAVLSAVGVAQALQAPGVRQVGLRIADLPAEMEGFRVVQLTDLHIGRLFHADWASQVVDRTNALDPDLILVTGDLIDGTPEARHADVAPLARLRAAHGVIAIPGNHEYYFDGTAWMRELQGLGMRMLVNQHAVVRVGNAELVVAGVADEAALRFGMDGPDLPAALKGAPVGAPVILLSHRPGGAREHAQAGVDVQLSGHTHGGMVRGMDQIVRLANGGYVSGRYDLGGMQLYVSNGTGLWNGFPLRLGVPAEITELVLTRAPERMQD